MSIISIFLSVTLGILLGVIGTAAFTRRALKRAFRAASFTLRLEGKEVPKLNIAEKLSSSLLSPLPPLQRLEETITDLSSLVEQLTSRSELLVTNIAAAVIMYSKDRQVMFASPYAEVLTGYSIEELTPPSGDPYLTMVVDEDRERYERSWKICELGEDILVRFRIRHQRGLKLWLETRLVPVLDSQGEVASILSVSIDVTDSLNYQRLIEDQNRDLSDFTYMVSHDLKAPIFTIKGMTAAVLEDQGTKLDEETCTMLRFVLEGADRLEKLVASVIEYASVSRKEMKETDVDLNSTLAQVKQDFSEQIRLADARIELPPTLPTVVGDPLRVYQVFSNLIGNAIKYRSPERQLVIAVTCRQISKDFVEVQIADNGSGIPQGKISDIFRPYHRAHNTDIEGSGIGLACVKKIIDRMGGTVAVSSKEKQGSAFTITMPLNSTPSDKIPASLERAYLS